MEIYHILIALFIIINTVISRERERMEENNSKPKEPKHYESLDLIKAEFEKQIHSECDFCKEPILYGEDYYYNGYDHMCSKCMGKFESKKARLTE